MAVRIQVRRDVAANWTSADPTLAQGELGLETDTGQIKAGDGSTAWTALAYIVSAGGETNTATNVGVGGVSIVDGKVVADLQFKSIAAASTKVLVTDDVANNNVDIDVQQGNLNHDALSNFVQAEHRVHPDPSVDNTLARYDGIVGDIQESSVVLDDSENMSGINELSTDGKVEAGDPGTESSGINVNGTTYATKLRANDIGGSAPAQIVLHRHSTSWYAALVGSRSNSDTSSHSSVTSGMEVFRILGTGWTGSHYDIFGEIRFCASSSGTISSTSSPGKIEFYTSPDGTDTPALAMTIEEDGVVSFATALTHSSLSGIGTNTHAQIDTHIADATLHFTEGSIDHTAITNIGANSHAQIDSDLEYLRAHVLINL